MSRVVRVRGGAGSDASWWQLVTHGMGWKQAGPMCFYQNIPKPHWWPETPEQVLLYFAHHVAVGGDGCSYDDLVEAKS